MLDIDGFRIDKALTITSDAQADWSEFIRKCAKNVGKTNFFLPGEIVSGNVLAWLCQQLRRHLTQRLAQTQIHISEIAQRVLLMQLPSTIRFIEACVDFWGKKVYLIFH
jgi:hypothetical protein